uniref:Uncharacterized protein n=1 Tax=Trypanosoma vivax (strain Y486) TaxID=1055687 RepID=G0TW70_TRYVY|nr:hypothetical protein TVY486_0503870 [Trypanosoma vivax Y486]
MATDTIELVLFFASDRASPGSRLYTPPYPSLPCGGPLNYDSQGNMSAQSTQILFRWSKGILWALWSYRTYPLWSALITIYARGFPPINTIFCSFLMLSREEHFSLSVFIVPLKSTHLKNTSKHLVFPFHIYTTAHW